MITLILKKTKILFQLRVFKKIDYIEKHFTVLNKNQTKDGPVSANPDQFKEIIKLSKMSEQDLKEYLKEMGVDIKKFLVQSQENLQKQNF